MNVDPELDPTRKSPTPRLQGKLDLPGTTANARAPGAHRYWHEPAFAFPKVGDVLENCRLVAELGYGSSGHVFLAQELALAERPIVLKVTVLTHEEHLNLARLQHTHIMPLFWVSSLSEMGLRVLAMPYLAKTTLAGLMQRLESSERKEWSGHAIFEELQQDQVGVPLQIPAQDHPAHALRQMKWMEFVVQLGRTLAEALAYAHRRGILHLDIKPSNIVITPDGMPILLDLDVARKPIAAGTPFVPWLGGTPSFMSPEQAAAMDALTRDQPIPQAVDERSDLYSLGMVLYTALGGISDARSRPDPASLPSINPDVSPGLAAILMRCLAEKPVDRYPDCNALAEDLDRHLHDLPLTGVHNRLPERWRKWRRRQPFGLPLAGLFLACCVAAVCAGLSDFQVHQERRTQAEAALAEGQEWQRKGQHEAAIRRFITGHELAAQTRGGGVLKEHLARGLHNARRLDSAGELTKAVHLMRFYAMQDGTPRRVQFVLEAAARNIWPKRGLLMDRSAGRLDQTIEETIESELQELVILWSDLQVRLAPPGHGDVVRGDIHRLHAEAKQLFGSSFAVSLAQEQHRPLAVGQERMEPRAAWEFCALARIAMAQDKHDAANRYLEHALERAPLDFVPNFYAGVLAMKQKRYPAAVQAFSYCLGKEPYAECFLLRGEAHAGLGDRDEALRDFNLALVKNPELVRALEQRGNLFRAMGRLQDAQKDLDRANQLRD